MKGKLRNRYYKQILLTLLVLCSIPVLFLGYYVFSFVETQMQIVYRSYASSLENEKERLETDFQYVDVSLIRLGLKTQCINSVSKPRVASHFQTFNAMQEELQLLCNTEENLKDVYLVSDDYDWVLTSTTFQPLAEHGDAVILDQMLQCGSVSFWQSDGQNLWVCKSLPINATVHRGMLTACFDSHAMLQNMSGIDSSSILMVMDQQQNILLSNWSEPLIWGDIQMEDEKYVQYGDTTLTKVSYQDENYILLQSPSTYSGWNYVLLIPTMTPFQAISRILLVAALVMIAFFVLAGVSIFVFSKRLFMPIDAIDSIVQSGLPERNDTPERPADGSGLLDRLKYIMSLNAEMNQALEYNKLERQQLFLSRIYQGELKYPSAEQFAQNGLRVEMQEDHVYFVAALKYHGSFVSDQDRALYLFALENVASELFEHEVVFPPVTINSVMYITLDISIGSDESAVMKMQMLAMMLITTVRKYIQLPLNIGVSQSIASLSDLHRGAEESKKALRDVSGAEGEVRLYHSYRADEYKGSHVGKRERLQLLHYIDMGERDICRKELKVYIRELSKLHYYLFKLEICKFISEVLTIYSDYALTPNYDKVSDIVDFDISQTVNSADRLDSYIWDYLLAPLFDVICNQVQERDVMQQLIEYILEGLENNVSLDECARHFNYNANYLSRWFKSKTGTTFTDFVASKKIERCKILLVESDISVNELAQRFGYSSPQNFIRVFKKYTLMTPGQYRKMEKDKLATEQDPTPEA